MPWVAAPLHRWRKKEHHVQVLVRDNNVDRALGVLKKKMQPEGAFREMKIRRHYEKPSEKRAREKAEAIGHARKLARKKLQQDGLLPMKPRVVSGARAERTPRAAPASEFQMYHRRVRYVDSEDIDL
jgi:small subunit ribosomal protein S21